jgi:(E)-4-hydroxy-3-methyl-but-2-enyl pyrophosphate reductase (IPP and DMAPP forming)
MEVKLAKTAGFCFGVERAVNKVYEQVEKGMKHIFTYGSIIHNEEVVNDLAAKGVQVIETIAEIAKITEGIMIIRSHGVGRPVYEMIKRQGLTQIDATCPFVLKIHRIVEKESRSGSHIVIIGNENHPEVIGIKGWSDTEVTVIENKEQAQEFSVLRERKVCIVSQTTFNYNKFQELVEIISKKRYDISVLNTICSATEIRQKEAKLIAREVEAMVVIGGKNSSNTQKLFEICKKECENTYYIQTLSDLDCYSLQSVSSVGITAGASTPNNIIEEVQKGCQN